MSLPSKMILPAVGSISLMIVRPSVVLPQPDSPTTPSVSPRRRSRSTPSTALHLADGVLEDARLDREVLDEPLDAEQLVLVGAGRAALPRLPCSRLAHGRSSRRRRRRLRGGELLGEMARETGALRRRRTAAAAAHPSWQTSRPCECAQRGWNAHPGGGVIRLGGWPGIGSSHSCVAVEPGQAVQEPDACTDGGRVEDREDVAELDDAARVHDDDAVGELGDQAEIVRDQDDRRVRLRAARPSAPRRSAPGSSRRAPSSARPRSGRSGRWRSPSRSSRAAACRRRTRAGTDRRAAPRRGRRRAPAARSSALRALRRSCPGCAP